MASISDLKEFIDYAEKNRKYAAGTARGRRAALKVFEEVLNEDELASIDLVRDRFMKIYQEVFHKNKKDLTAKSLETYKARVEGLIKDYEKYGSDPGAFSSWDTTRKREPKSDGESKTSRVHPYSAPVQLFEAEVIPSYMPAVARAEEIEASDAISNNTFAAELNKIEVHLRPGFKVTLVLPSDMTRKEAGRLKHMIDGMVVQDDTD